MNASLSYKRGDTNPAQMTADSGAAIMAGNLVFRDPSSYKARNASSMGNQGAKDINQKVFKQMFAGVALQRGGILNTGEVSFNLNPLPAQIVVATEGEFEFACAATAFYPGDLVGPAANTAGTGLQDQTVEKVTSAYNAIGVAVPEANAIGQSRTSVVVRIFGTVFDSGVESPYTSGSSSGV